MFVPSLPRGIVLDSNLLLLLLVGSYEPRTLRNFKRLSSYSHHDLRLLQDIVFGRNLLVSPHLLTEVSNLANALPELLRQGFYRYMTAYVPKMTEHPIDAVRICSDRSFILFGLTDAALCLLATQALVVTEDGRLRDYMRRQGLGAISLPDMHHHYRL